MQLDAIKAGLHLLSGINWKEAFSAFEHGAAEGKIKSPKDALSHISDAVGDFNSIASHISGGVRTIENVLENDVLHAIVGIVTTLTHSANAIAIVEGGSVPDTNSRYDAATGRFLKAPEGGWKDRPANALPEG